MPERILFELHFRKTSFTTTNVFPKHCICSRTCKPETINYAPLFPEFLCSGRELNRQEGAELDFPGTIEMLGIDTFVCSPIFGTRS